MIRTTRRPRWRELEEAGMAGGRVVGSVIAAVVILNISLDADCEHW